MIPRGAVGGVTRASSINRLTKPAGSRPSRGKPHALWLSFVLLVASGDLCARHSDRSTGGNPFRGFSESIVFSGLTESDCRALCNTPDGRVFVAEKRGVIKVFDSLTDTTPTVFADLNVNVYNFWDRGLLGMALDPNFPTEPLRVRAVYLRPRTRDNNARAALGYSGCLLGPLSNPTRRNW